ncbi:MAG: SNF2-related protein [Myxococcota bacterium]|nr:SNF2-related protein [Myxococcota bacterium]
MRPGALLADALASIRRRVQPTPAEAPWVDDVIGAVREGEFDEALALARDAVDEGVRHPLIRAALALDAIETGDAKAIASTLRGVNVEMLLRGAGAPSRSAVRAMERELNALAAAFGAPGGVKTDRVFRRAGEKTFSESLRKSLARPDLALERTLREAKRRRMQAPAPVPAEVPAAAREEASSPRIPAALRERVAWIPEEAPAVAPPDVVLEEEDAAGVGDGPAERLRSGAVDGLRLVRLARAAVDLRSARHFDTLLALGHVRDVRHLSHQIETARRVLRDFRGRALLADEVGLGKTIEAGLIVKEHVLRGLARSVLILCPPSLVEQWRDEMAAKFGLEFAVPRKGDERFFESGDRLLCSIHFARRAEQMAQAQARRFDLVVVDEAHHLKNRRTLGFQLVDGLKRRGLLLLTATPVQNDLEELYNLVTLLRPGHLGTPATFSRRFMTRGDRRLPRDRDALRELLGEVMIRNTRALVDLRLPPRFVHMRVVEPTDAERALYGAISDHVRARARAEPGRERALLLTLLTEAGSSPAAVLSTLEGRLSRDDLPADHREDMRALQVRCAGVGETSKARVLLDLLAEAAGDKVVVFVKYRATLAALEGLLGAHGIPAAVFHGGMPAAEKEEAIRAFRSEAPVLLSTEVGGEGRNLQFCRRMVNFDLPWNPFALEQRIGRLHRIGQEREVHVTNLCARGTAEDYLLSVLHEKLNMFELVIGELDMILGDLEGDLGIENRVFSIWTGADGEAGLRDGFARLGDELAAARRSYEETRAVDQAIFGRDFEAG